MPTWQCSSGNKCANAKRPDGPSVCCNSSIGIKKKQHLRKFIMTPRYSPIRTSSACPWCIHVGVGGGKASRRHCCKRLKSVWCGWYSLEFTHCPVWGVPLGANSLYSTAETVYTPDVTRTNGVTHTCIAPTGPSRLLLARMQGSPSIKYSQLVINQVCGC